MPESEELLSKKITKNNYRNVIVKVGLSKFPFNYNYNSFIFIIVLSSFALKE